MTNCIDIMNKLYSYEDFKKLSEVIFTDDSLINSLHLNHETLIKEPYELLSIIREDVLNMNYEKLHGFRYTNDEYSLRIELREKQPIVIKGIPQATATRREYMTEEILLMRKKNSFLDQTLLIGLS